MSNYSNVKSAHQYYRDVFSSELVIGDIGGLSKDIIVDIFVKRSCDIYTLNKKLSVSQSNLPPEQDKALRLLLNAIALSNLTLDEKWKGQQVRLPSEYIDNIVSYLGEVLDVAPNLEYLVVSIQILFRIGAIEHAVTLIENNLEVLQDVPVVFKILLLTCILEEDYQYAMLLAQRMAANSYLIGEDPLALLMVVTTIFKSGGYPDSYIDFTSLISKKDDVSYDHYQWLLKREIKNDKPTILISCDVKYYHQHAVSLIYSLYESNRDSFNVHLHVYDADELTIENIKIKHASLPELNISCTLEPIGNVSGINVHYACRRFTAANYLLSIFQGPLLIVDADSLIKNNWRFVEPKLVSSDIALTKSEGAPFWEKAIAGFVYLNGSEESRRFIKKVALFIWNNLKKNNVVWFLDQVALSAVLDGVGESTNIARIDTSLVFDINHQEGAFMWAVTTIKDAENNYSAYKNYLLEKYNLIA
ncbi:MULTISPECIES: hypothetical protein [Dickeya]|uniref:Uncharacterized protein n=1 Tax=Dickeya aquatica TaxID=1401087 RepID=A0A375ACB4_9GAMM|nr:MULTISPECIES: hypothetical protein [Dickeya]SLM63732.1 hypothetical protein DAQ1742_02883 [Dickeya aquatica]